MMNTRMMKIFECDEFLSQPHNNYMLSESVPS